MESEEWETDGAELVHEIKEFHFHLYVLQRSSLSLDVSGIASASYGSWADLCAVAHEPLQVRR